MMKRLALLATLGAAALLAAAFQNPSETTLEEDLFQPVENNEFWLEPKAGVQISAAEALENAGRELGLLPEDEFRLLREQKDQLGFTHYRYRQYRRGIPIEAATLLLHEKDRQLASLNGKWVKGKDRAATDAAFGPEQAIAYALQALPAETYLWEQPRMEALLKRIEDDPDATAYPQPELVLVDPSFEQRADNLQLAYRLEISAAEPHFQKMAYINARTGELLHTIEQLHQHNTPGNAQTLYSGEQEIIADSMESDRYRLRETARGLGIETYNMRENTNYDTATDFIDEDNHWNAADGIQNGAATDAHWGAEMTFDYFLERHNYEGLDGEGMALINYINYDRNYGNAFWNGRWATYGNGDGNTFNSSLATVDIVAHEFVHGITDKTADLIYQDESGAINESFSDIFGAVVEFYATPELGDWYIGEDATVDDDGIRNMSNPNDANDPDTYLGSFWFTGNADNGGVHTNSGVQNYWFYLLTEGGEGENDNGESFAVFSLGMEKASRIAFRNLQFYLAEASNHQDARLGSIRAARDMFGDCSYEVIQTTNAWQAVGVGQRFPQFDLSPRSLDFPSAVSCGFPADGKIAASFQLRSCVQGLAPGKPLPIAFQVDDGPVVKDTVLLSGEMQHEDIVEVVFNQPAEVLSGSGEYQLKVWTDLDIDNIPKNDTLFAKVDNVPEQNVDLAVRQISQPFSGCFLDEAAVELEIAFLGCDSLPAGAVLEASFQLNEDVVVTESLTTPRTLYRDESFVYRFETPAAFPQQADNQLRAWLDYTPDYLSRNDTLALGAIANPKPVGASAAVSFEAGAAALDSLYFETGSQAELTFSSQAGFESSSSLQITGNNSLEAFEDDAYFPPINDEAIWTANPAYNSQVCFCADLGGIPEPILLFDLRQLQSPTFIVQKSVNNRRMNALRVLVNGEVVSPPFFRDEFFSDPWRSIDLPLQDYQGQQIEICFQAHTGLSPENDPLSVGDVILLDNVQVGDVALSSKRASAPLRDWSVFPNPAAATAQLRLQSPEAQSVRIELFSMDGRQLWQQRRDAVPGENNWLLPTASLPEGVYLIRLWANGAFSSRKLVKTSR